MNSTVVQAPPGWAIEYTLSDGHVLRAPLIAWINGTPNVVATRSGRLIPADHMGEFRVVMPGNQS